MTRRIRRTAAIGGMLVLVGAALADSAAVRAQATGRLPRAVASTLADAPTRALATAGVRAAESERRLAAADAIVRGPGVRGPGTTDAPTAVSLETPGTNERISIGPKGEELPAQSTDPSISEDGQRIAFLVTSVVDSQTTTAIVLRDRSNDTTTVIYPTASRGSSFLTSRLPVSRPVISGDGTWVAFQVGYGKQDQIVLWSAATGVIDPLAEAKLRLSFAVMPSLSRDGRYLAFIGELAAVGAVTTPRYYVLDRQTGSLVAVGFDENGREVYASQYLGEIAISGDGAVVAYADYAPGADIRVRQVWRMAVGGTQATLVSASISGGDGDGDSTQPALNRSGSTVVFTSDASDLVDGDTNGQTDVFRWTASGVRRVSVAPDGTQANGGSLDPAVTASGRQIAFASWATNLVPGDTTGALPPNQDRAALTDIFILDTPTVRLSRVSVGVGGSEPDDSSVQPALSASGKQVAFASLATNLVANDANGFEDVFLRDRLPDVTVSTNPTDFGAASVGAPPGVKRTATVASVGGWAARITGVSLTGSGAGSFLVSNDACSGATLYLGETCTIEITFLPTVEGKKAAALVVAASSPTKPNAIRLTGAGSAGTISLDPKSGPPGTVTVVTGSGFGQGLPITLSWSAGITPIPLEPVVTDAKGAFTVQVLVLPNDRTGPRGLRVVATLPTGPGTTVSARFVVTTPTGVPPMFGRTQRFMDPFGRVIVLRR